jgi:hypothetical protein
LNDVILARLGLRIKGINETTRDRVATAIKNGLDAGHSAAELGDDVAETAAFDEYRAELIARTESARVLNDSQLETFREFDVEQVTAIDGDDDEVCADRNGQTFRHRRGDGHRGPSQRHARLGARGQGQDNPLQGTG